MEEDFGNCLAKILDKMSDIFIQRKLLSERHFQARKQKKCTLRRFTVGSKRGAERLVLRPAVYLLPRLGVSKYTAGLITNPCTSSLDPM